MGCSISTLDTLLAKAIEQHPSSSSFTSSSLSKSHSLSTSLVHHPPLCQGDTTHLVFLTSSSYGSLILNDQTTPPPPSIEVINTWELMEGLEEFDDGVKVSSCEPGSTALPLKVDGLGECCGFVEPQKIPSSSLALNLCVNGVKIGSCESGSTMGVDLSDFIQPQKMPGSSLGLKLCDNGEKIGSCEPGSTMGVDLSYFIEPQKMPGSSLGLNLCDNGEKIGSCEPGSSMGVDLNEFIEPQKLPGSSLGLNLCDDDVKIGSCELGSTMGVDSSDFNEPQKIPGSSLGLNLCDNGEKIGSCELGSTMGFDMIGKDGVLSDFVEPQKISSSSLGLSLCENVKKLNKSYVFVEMPKRENGGNNLNLNSKPLWKLLSEESLFSKMNHNVVSNHQNELPSRRSGCDQPMLVSSKSCTSFSNNGLNGCEDKIVLYHTSLRGIRRTYDDCCTVRMILRGFKVVVDERDISMDSNYKKELQHALGGKIVSLPHLFVGGKHIGGIDEIKRLHENGELEKSLDGFPIQDRGFACEICGESRFIPCLKCYGSRKLFNEEECRMRRCPECNENGLVRCPGCC